MRIISFLKRLSIKFILKILNNLRRIKILNRLLICFSVLIIIPNFIIGYASYNKSAKNFEKNSFQYSYDYISNLNIRIQEKLNKYDDIAERIYSNKEIRNMLEENSMLEIIKNQRPIEYEENKLKYKERINEYLYSLTDNDVNLLNIEIVTENEQFTQISSNDSKKGCIIGDISAFNNLYSVNKAIKSNGYTIWDYNLGNDLGIYSQYSGNKISPNITLLKSIKDYNSDKSLGIIVMNISLNIFIDAYEPQELANKGSVLLINDSRVFVSLNENVSMPILDKETIKEIGNSKSGNIIKKIDGAEYLLTFQTSSFTGWTTVSVIPKHLVLSSVYELRKEILLTAGICLLLSLILAYLVTLSITMPLKKLKKVMETIDEDNINIQYKDNKNDDISKLGNIFNQMIQRINRLVEEVYRADSENKQNIIKRKGAELDALQMQINPHFLYNTLDIIRWEAIAVENGDGKLSEMISDFSKLLRLSTKKCEALVKLSEEFEHVKGYIKVISFSYSDKYSIVWNIQDEALLNYKITKLTIQPLIENAVVHGFKNVDREKILTISGYRAEDNIMIEVCDNGCGIEEDKLKKLNENINTTTEEANVVGLRNVNLRLKLSFGEEYGLSVYSVYEKGTKVIIKVPAIM